MNKTSLFELVEWLNCLENQDSKRVHKFIKPFHLATLAIYAKNHGLKDIENYFDTSIIKYATRMKLWEILELTPPYNINEHARKDRFLEIKAVKSEIDVDTISKNLENIISSQNNLDKESQDSVGIVLSELLGNCYHHANPEPKGLFGLVVAQTWKKGNLAQIAIADAGVGIRRTLSNNPNLIKVLSTKNACELATEYTITGKPNEMHSGYGLTLSKEILERNNGNFIIVSGKEAFQSCGKIINNDRELKIGWNGTLIIFEWNTDQPLDAKAVYDNWTELDKHKQLENYDESLEDLF